MNTVRLLDIPDLFKAVNYLASRTPEVKDPENLSLGANCQVYAYEILRHFGKFVPNYRSSEQWEDLEHSKKVYEFEPLDLMFYNDLPKAYGAHVGVYVENGLVLHLSKENGKPKFDKHADLLTN